MSGTTLYFDLIARDKASKTLLGIGRSADTAHSKLLGMAVKGAAGFGVLSAAAGVFAYKVGSDYVASLNKIQALTGANDKQMKAAAKSLESNAGLYAKMGQTTGDAASGVVELTKSGLSLSDALQSVYGTMTLAKAGELDVADASAITANALNTFHLSAKKAGDVANYLANAANISSADVSDIAESFKYVAPVAASAGVSIKQVNAILAELANAGIKGSSAGTALRTFLLNLQAPTSAASKALGDLNIQVFDSAGKMKPLSDIIGQLGGKLNGLSQQEKAADLKAIFGKVGIAGATTILKEGSKGLAEYTKGVGRAGAASKLAEAKSQGLAGSFAIIKASAISGAQSIYRQFSPIADKVIRPLATKFATFAQNIGPDMQQGLKKIGDVAKKLNLSGVGKSLASQAKAWAAPVIAGFSTGLNSGDWSGLGKALGNGIIKALGALGDLTSKLGSVLGKIDWVGLGDEIGKEAPSLIIGFAAGLLNFDMGNLFKGIIKHWQDVLIAVIVVAFTPAKVVDALAGTLARIPFAGKLLAWGLRAFKGLADGLKGWVWDALKFMGRQFLSGFRRVFPEVGAGFAKALELFPTRIAVMALDVQKKGYEMVFKLGRAIAKGTGSVIAKIGELIARMLRPFVDANTWLVRKGVEFLSGLLRGFTSKVGDVIGWVKSLAGKILGAIPNPLSLLESVGRNIISGLWSGMEATWSKVSSWLSSKINSLSGIAKKLLGIHSPSKVFIAIGGNVMEGLIQGIGSKTVPLQNILQKVVSQVQAAGQKLKNAISARNQFASGFQSFTSSAFGADFGTDANGNPNAPTVSSILAYQQAQATQAHMVKTDVRKLVKMGLSPALIKQLQAAGESGIAEIQALANATPAQIRQFNRLNKQTSSDLRTAGMSAGNAIYGEQIKADRKHAREEHHLLREIRDAIKHMNEKELVAHIHGGDLIIAVRHAQRKKGQKPTV